MAHSEDSANHVLRFCWGKKRGVGGTKRNIQFYESFMIDDVSYSLYDCVYLYEMDALEPYIGKIVKIWEQPDGKKKVKILWFFRPNELQNYLGDHTPLEREIFLATGEGVGLFNINPLEAIAGKCSVICTSKDERNRKPSNEELDMADYIFCHTFDVQSYKISEKIDDKIAGVEAKFLLNRKDNQQQSSISRFEEKYDSGKAGPSTPIPSPMSKLDPSQTLENKADDRTECAPASAKRDNAVVSELLEGQCPLYEKIHSKSENAFAKDKEEAVLISENHAEDNLNHGKNKSNLSLIDSKPSKKMRLDTSAEASNDTSLRNLKFEYSGDGSSKEFVHLHNESFGKKNDALVDNKPPEEKFIDARTDAMSDASSRKQKFESNGDDSLGEIVHLRKESSEKNGALVEKKISLKMKLTDAPAEALNDASSRKQKIGPDGHGSLKEIASLHKEFPEKRKLIEKKTILLDEPLKEALPMSIGNKKKSDDVLEVTRRPDADRSKWFKGLPWEERMQKADEQGTLVFIENLDPLYTSSEVEDIIYHTLKQSCTARVIQQATFQNPNYGQAYAIFKTRDAADFAVSKINKGCIQLPNGSSLLCSKGMLKVPKSSMCGHLSVNKNKLQMREMKRAVSTSHCSQPNTIEYEMAMDWLFIQERSVRCLKALHKGQADELKEFKKRLKTK